MNHLSYADDTILFTSGSTKSLLLIMKTLKSYEYTSGQLIDYDKGQLWFIKLCLTVQKKELEESMVSRTDKVLSHT